MWLGADTSSLNTEKDSLRPSQLGRLFCRFDSTLLWGFVLLLSLFQRFVRLIFMLYRLQPGFNLLIRFLLGCPALPFLLDFASFSARDKKNK